MFRFNLLSSSSTRSVSGGLAVDQPEEAVDALGVLLYVDEGGGGAETVARRIASRSRLASLS